LNELVRDDILRRKNTGAELTLLEAELWKRREEISAVLENSDPPAEHEFTNLKAAIDLLRNIVGAIDEEPDDVGSVKPGVKWKRAETTMAQIEIRRLHQGLNEQTKANVALEKYVALVLRLIEGKWSNFEEFTTPELGIIANYNYFPYYHRM
jgi:hypothetical protein